MKERNEACLNEMFLDTCISTCITRCEKDINNLDKLSESIWGSID